MGLFSIFPGSKKQQKLVRKPRARKTPIFTRKSMTRRANEWEKASKNKSFFAFADIPSSQDSFTLLCSDCAVSQFVTMKSENSVLFRRRQFNNGAAS